MHLNTDQWVWDTDVEHALLSLKAQKIANLEIYLAHVDRIEARLSPTKDRALTMSELHGWVEACKAAPPINTQPRGTRDHARIQTVTPRSQ